MKTLLVLIVISWGLTFNKIPMFLSVITGAIYLWLIVTMIFVERVKKETTNIDLKKTVYFKTVDGKTQFFQPKKGENPPY